MPVQLSMWIGARGPRVRVGDRDALPVESVGITDSGVADLNAAQARDVADHLYAAARDAEPGDAHGEVRLIIRREDAARRFATHGIQVYVEGDLEAIDTSAPPETWPAPARVALVMLSQVMSDAASFEAFAGGRTVARKDAQHHGHVVDRFGTAAAYAECTCGWRGPERHGLSSRGADAAGDLAMHYQEVGTDGT